MVVHITILYVFWGRGTIDISGRWQWEGKQLIKIWGHGNSIRPEKHTFLGSQGHWGCGVAGFVRSLGLWGRWSYGVAGVVWSLGLWGH